MSCYKFAPGSNPNSFVFPTDHGWIYTVSFINNATSFEGIKILENEGLSFEIIFERSELGVLSRNNDPYIQLTIQAILMQQLEYNGTSAIYYFLCDTKDSQETARARLFTRWHRLCPLEGWELFNFELADPNDEESVYYTGLFIHAQHPNIEQIPDAFERFLQEDVSRGKIVGRR